jgi:hypothetical protein
VRATSFRRGSVVAVALAVTAASGCGEFARASRAPAQLVIVSILTASSSGSVPTTGFTSGPLLSDVVTATGVFDDFGQVTFRTILRDPGAPGVVLAPTPLNDITITEYEVRYRLPNGRNAPGVDVPHPVRGALTLTVPVGSLATGVFELVRHVAKLEPPLATLNTNLIVLTTIADVTFFGRDQAGNRVSAMGSVQVNFAQFGD